MVYNDRFLRACRREETDTTPIWLMRQAGRYMPEYRALKEHHSFLEMVKTPDLATQITMQPVNAFGPDAAIIFADLLPPLEGLGFQLSYEKGEGPVIHNPINDAAAVAALPQPNPRETSAYTLDAIRLTLGELAGRIPLIGFAGAPFTLASYAIEGGSSRDLRKTKTFMFAQPQAWHHLMDRLATLTEDYLRAQIEAGVQAVQIFDSWAGHLAPFDYQESVLPYVQRIIANLKPLDVPIIYFGTDMNGLLGSLRRTEADVIGIDWRIPLDEAWAALGPGYAVQGNLDPHTLLGPWDAIERRASDILERAAGRPGHIFNLGHGILQWTPVENVARLIAFVREAGKRDTAAILP